MFDIIEFKSYDAGNDRLLNDVRRVIFSAVIGLDARYIDAFSYKYIEGEDKV